MMNAHRVGLVMACIWTVAILAGVPGPAAAQDAGAAAWTAPRTPWDDPDLQGAYTNKYEQGTPFERPAEFEGRGLDEVTRDEFEAILEERQANVFLGIALAGGDPAGNLGGPLHWQDQFEVSRGRRPWLVVDPADGQIPALTAEARRRPAARRGRGADSWEDRSLYDRCITRGLPGSMMPAIYGNSYEIVQAPGWVAIRYEMVHETRVVPIGDAPGVGPSIAQHMGAARGWWEGETLVVETTNFRPESVYRGADPGTLTLVERFTRVAPDRVEWAVTVQDPSTWVRPWTFAMPLTLNADEPIMEYACHEGNRAMANILSAARAEERAGRLTEFPTGAEGER